MGNKGVDKIRRDTASDQDSGECGHNRRAPDTKSFSPACMNPLENWHSPTYLPGDDFTAVLVI